MGSSKKIHDASRAERKAKKRKLEDAVPDLPGDEQVNGKDVREEKPSKKRKRGNDGDAAIDKEMEKETKKEKKAKKRRQQEAEDSSGSDGGVVVVAEEEIVVEKKKSKKDKKKDHESTIVEPEVDAVVAEVEEGLRKSKKERKAERRAAEATKSKHVTSAADSKSNPEEKVNGDADAAGDEEKKSKKNNRNREKKRKGAAGIEGAAVNQGEQTTAAKEKKDARFICFIGNLPFTATTQSINKHFISVKPISVRALTHKDNPTKSKGIAFLEFEGYDHMKTCLKLFHHSMFDDGLSEPRKINVELTAGGGGNTKDRRAKIQKKNHKLNEQRVHRIQEEERAKLEKSTNAAAIDESAIHPSRRTRVPGL